MLRLRFSWPVIQLASDSVGQLAVGQLAVGQLAVGPHRNFQTCVSRQNCGGVADRGSTNLAVSTGKSH